ncbi:MAG TPA: aldehyde dehydrogenase family protein [Vicinamibacterales bacterium]|nr:aldehyde dehydrogenase family protein [Vicinamibacterales bacterium]
MIIPERIRNWIAGEERDPQGSSWMEKLDPTTGTVLSRFARSAAADVAQAVEAAAASQPGWAAVPAVQRGLMLHDLVRIMQARRDELAEVVARETGKSRKDSAGEVSGAIQLGLFFASEGQRLYGRTTTSATAFREAMTVREPVGVAGLIVPANTPIANIAWKAFPALVCGNAAVLKAAEDAPAIAWLFARYTGEVGLPAGVFNVVQGLGSEAGASLVADPRVGVVSFTGSTHVGREIQRVAGERLARVSLELGGKNALVVCDDADLDEAVKWAVLSAFSNAGQRCASASRVIVFDRAYEEFRRRLLDRVRTLRVGPADDDDFGAVINERQLQAMLAALQRARAGGARVLAGGHRLSDRPYADGYYMAPTVVEGLSDDDEMSCQELFGPITALYRVAGFNEALELANHSPYGLTACIHTTNIDRAWVFCRRVQAGVAVVNAGTYGSEPHMPFGGVKQSGNGTREPGTEALDVYSSLKNIYMNLAPERAFS